MKDPQQIDTAAANLGPAWARVAGECTETPTQRGEPITDATTRATIDDRVLLVAKRLQADPDLLLWIEFEIYQRSIATLGG